jgi:hypothetical protein
VAQAGLLELGGQPQQGGLVAEAAKEVDADGQPGGVPSQRHRHRRCPGDVGHRRREADERARTLGRAQRLGRVETISPSGTGGSDRVGVSQASMRSWAKNRATTRANACRSSRASR